MKKNQTERSHYQKFIKGEVAFERVLFFCDAIVAIAITLLAMELKINIPENQEITFHDLLKPWHQYAAFILSFVSIAGFWKSHHDFYISIKKLDEQLLYLNILWLFFIIILPFSTRLLSGHFGAVPAAFLYSLNIFLIAVCQNFIWDTSDKKGFVDKNFIDAQQQTRFRLMLNLDMLNGLIAVAVSFFYPVAAFITLFFKVPVFIFAFLYIGKQRRKQDNS